MKNRIHGTLAGHNVQIPGADLLGVEARLRLVTRLPELPIHCREAIEQELATLDFLEMQIGSAEERLEEFARSREVQAEGNRIVGADPEPEIIRLKARVLEHRGRAP